jgi:hypothetical protein
MASSAAGHRLACREGHSREAVFRGEFTSQLVGPVQMCIHLLDFPRQVDGLPNLSFDVRRENIYVGENTGRMGGREGGRQVQHGAETFKLQY